MNITSSIFTKDCTFENTFDFNSLRGRSICEMAYVRMDYSGKRWWTSGFSVHKETETPERVEELVSISTALIDTFPSLSDLEEFCILNAEDLRNGQEYNLYVNGAEMNYWLRVNTKGNYHVYIHAFTKN